MKFVNSGWLTFRYRHVLYQSPTTNKIFSQLCARGNSVFGPLTHECKDTELKMWRKTTKENVNLRLKYYLPSFERNEFELTFEF